MKRKDSPSLARMSLNETMGCSKSSSLATSNCLVASLRASDSVTEHASPWERNDCMIFGASLVNYGTFRYKAIGSREKTYSVGGQFIVEIYQSLSLEAGALF